MNTDDASFPNKGLYFISSYNHKDTGWKHETT